MNTQTPFDYDVDKLERKVKGVDPKLVQLILDDAREEWRSMEQKFADLQSKLLRYEEERSVVNSALITAQKHSEDLIKNAEADAQKVLEETNTKSEHLMAEARIKAEAALAEANRENERKIADGQATLREIQDEVERYTILKQKAADELRDMLKGYLNDLDKRVPQSSHAVHSSPAESDESASESASETHA